jgi:CubicO group peptidase (beta-lactamase class C family)
MAERRPERGSHAPGTFWYYNNWDFNVLGALLRRATGEDTFAAVDKYLAQPLQMQDFTPADGRYVRTDASEHPAYPMHFTARDLARFGWLYLNAGRWHDQQVVPASGWRRARRPIRMQGLAWDMGICGGYQKRIFKSTLTSALVLSPRVVTAANISSWRQRIASSSYTFMTDGSIANSR